MDAHAGSPPNHILGYTIRSRTRIYVSYILPSAFELAIYIAQIIADAAVSYQHFRTKQPDFGWATLSLILVPPLLTFVLILSSRHQRANPQHTSRRKFVGYQLLTLLLFPFFAVYRIMVRVFWSIEALFHDNNDSERMLCLAKAEECSTCELYHFIQAYGQSAPQIILQLFHMLTQDLFRNFQTTDVQAISLVFSAIDLAATTTSYQRFESQRKVGRHYPWWTVNQVEKQRQLITKNACLRNECEEHKRASERTIASFPESDKIMANFKLRNNEAEFDQSTLSAPKTHEVQVHSYDEVDNEGTDSIETLLLGENASKHNATDDDKIKIISPKQRLLSIREEMRKANEIEILLDTVPNSPAPAPPFKISVEPQTPQPQLRTQLSANSETSTARNKRSSKRFSQLETFKDMLIVNAQLYIKEHMPRPPKMLITRVDEKERNDEQPFETAPLSPGTPLPSKDVVDFFLPRQTKIVYGIQQDDFVGKTVSFFGWISFIIMRMLSLSTFCVFYPRVFLILISCHYVVMLGALFLESRFKGKANRTLFYLLLAYVYIFVLLEFRVKFGHVRIWFVGYFLITMAENIAMTTIWYAREEFESWWFGYIFEGIIYSGILFVATLLVYYFILKPKDVNLIVEDDQAENKSNS